MGVTYHYANLTKREWFDVAALGGNSKFAGVGYSLTTRAFDLLLVKTGRTSNPKVVECGRWCGDSIAIIGDTDERWEEYYLEFSDLSADVILLVFSNGGFQQIGEAAADDIQLFRQICHLVVTRQAMELEPLLKQFFGTDWTHRYQKSCDGDNHFTYHDLIRTRAG